MLSRIIISVAMAAALFMAPVGFAARSCILANAPSQKACQPSCCANKTCCATSPKNTTPPSQPLAKADSGQRGRRGAKRNPFPFMEILDRPHPQHSGVIHRDGSRDSGTAPGRDDPETNLEMDRI